MPNTLYYEDTMSRVGITPWGPVMFGGGGGETVTISLDRYESLKNKPKELAEEHDRELKRATDKAAYFAKLEMFCDILQHAIQRFIDTQQLLPLHQATVAIDKSCPDRFSVKIVDTQKTSDGQLFHILYYLRDQKFTRNGTNLEAQFGGAGVDAMLSDIKSTYAAALDQIEARNNRKRKRRSLATV